jgi:hypothetical protein
VEDHVDAFAGAEQAVPVADVPDQEPQVPVAMPMALVELLCLVAPEDADDLRVERQEVVDQPPPDRPGASGDEDASPAKVRRTGDDGSSCGAGRRRPAGPITPPAGGLGRTLLYDTGRPPTPGPSSAVPLCQQDPPPE